jgi:hypothetical protein
MAGIGGSAGRGEGGSNSCQEASARVLRVLAGGPCETYPVADTERPVKLIREYSSGA